MIVIQHSPKRVVVNVYGEFSLADYQEFEALVNFKVKFEGPVDLFFDLREMADFTLDVAWEELVFARAHPNDFRRIAVLTHDQWIAWSTWLAQIFVDAQMRVFDDETDALFWLDENREDAEASFSSLISCADLAEHLDNENWRIFDARHRLNDLDYGEKSYAQGHLPGAAFLHLDRDLSGPKDASMGRHPLPNVAVFAQKLGELGVTPKTQVVVYDDAGGVMASRLWWMLRWLGHERVAVLDGGLPQWLKEGRSLTSDIPEFSAASFVPQPQDWVVSSEAVLANLEQNEFVVIDARAPDRFRGENETLDPVGGHIPGARNRFFRDNLDAEGLFRAPAELRREFLALLAGSEAENVVMQCGSGVSACHNLLAMEVAGLRGAKLYAGSWSAWCSDPRRPVAR